MKKNLLAILAVFTLGVASFNNAFCPGQDLVDDPFGTSKGIEDIKAYNARLREEIRRYSLDELMNDESFLRMNFSAMEKLERDKLERNFEESQCPSCIKVAKWLSGVTNPWDEFQDLNEQ